MQFLIFCKVYISIESINICKISYLDFKFFLIVEHDFLKSVCTFIVKVVSCFMVPFLNKDSRTKETMHITYDPFKKRGLLLFDCHLITVTIDLIWAQMKAKMVKENKTLILIDVEHLMNRTYKAIIYNN